MTAPQIPQAVKVMMATRERRLHHYIWHQVRNLWFEFTDTERQEITSDGWAPPRPAVNQQGDVDLANKSGEDFLYMHRAMIANVNAKLAQIADPSYPKIAGWEDIPAPGDPDYPVPPPWDTGFPGLNQALDTVKANDFFTQQMQPLNARFKDSEYLRTVTLGELGARIEFTVHNWMHMRWCSQVSQIRPDPQQFSTDIDPRWDDVAYDWLGDTYSSHVNSVFWKLHGWVNDRIKGWRRANNITGPIQWTGTWVGPMPMHPSVDSLHAMLQARVHDDYPPHHDHYSQMVKIFRVLARSGKCSHFYDRLFILEEK
jgi:hypothetical protein